MKEGILAVSFGTSVEEARLRQIEPVEQAIAAACPQAVFYRAYTSPTIRRILAERGTMVQDLEGALEQMAAEGITHGGVQPTHLLYGYEYDRIRQTVEKWRPRFERLTLGRPLLADTDTLLEMGELLDRIYPRQPGRAVVLMGHGTHHPANMAYPALQTVLNMKGRPDLLVGTVEGWPSLEELLPVLKAGGYQKVTAVPLMLVAGDHALNDMAGEEPESWKSRLTQAGFSVDCRLQGLGELEEVQRLYANRARMLLEGEE